MRTVTRTDEMVDTVVEEVEAANNYTGLASAVIDIANVITKAADDIQAMEDGEIVGKAEFRKAAVQVRADLKPVIEMVKGVRKDILSWRAEKLSEIPGARKSKSKEQLVKEAQELMARAEAMAE